MNQLEITRQAYSEILNALNKHREICAFDVDGLGRRAKTHLFGLELKEKYGLNIDPYRIDSLDWNRFGEYRSIGVFGEKHNRRISWSVDGRQPENELLFMIGFPTGPYIFGDGDIYNKDYPQGFFQKFWLELKSFNPDYVDEANHALYWSVENAKEVFNSFEEILEKYNELNREDIKQRRIDKMKKELAKLEGK